jgi:hypothetical protein
MPSRRAFNPHAEAFRRINLHIYKGIKIMSESIFTRHDRINAVVNSIWGLEQQAEKMQTLLREKQLKFNGEKTIDVLNQTLKSMTNDLELLTGLEGVCLWQSQKREYVARVRKEFNI